MRRRSKLPTNGDGAAMAKCSATSASYGQRASEPSHAQRLAADVKAGRMSRADAMAEIERLDPIEGSIWLEFWIGE